MGKKNKKKNIIIKGEKQVIDENDVGDINDVIGTSKDEKQTMSGEDQSPIEKTDEETVNPDESTVNKTDEDSAKDPEPPVEKTDGTPEPPKENGPEVVDNSGTDVKKEDVPEVSNKIQTGVTVKENIKIKDSFINTSIRVDIRGAGYGKDFYGIMKVGDILKSAMTIGGGFVKVPNKYVKSIIKLGKAVKTVPGISVITDKQRNAVEFRIKPMNPNKK